MTKSKYDKITTARELLNEVISNGLSTNQDDRNRAADIFGNSSVGDLAKLANANEVYSGKSVSDMFYFIAFNIWNWREAISFYNTHTSAISQTRDELRRLQKEHHGLAETNKYHSGMATDLQNQLEELEPQLEAAQQEIMALKAKLYDLMTAGA